MVLASAANLGVDDVFTDSDASDLKSVVKAAAKKDGSFGSLEDTFDAVNALTDGLGYDCGAL